MRTAGVACLLAVLVDATATLQQPTISRPGGPIFQSRVDLVALNVTVTDRGREFVGGLTQENFEVFENGRKQDVLFFAAGRVPLDVAIAIDTSASMIDRLGAAKQAAIGLVEALQPADAVAVIAFGDRAHLVQPLAGDIRAATAAIRQTRTSGSTALYDALYLALRQLSAARTRARVARRPAIILLSDGEDTTSLVGYEDVLDLARETDIALYAIAFLPDFNARAGAPFPKPSMQPRYVMQSLAQETGGRAFFPNAVEELDSIYGKVADELANQYTLGYSPADARANGVFRRIFVRVVDRPETLVHTRTGYRAAGMRRR